VSEAAAESWTRWQSSAKFSGVMINGPVGNLSPGGLQGAGFEKDLAISRIRVKAAKLPNVRKAKAARSVAIEMPSEGIARGSGIQRAQKDSPDRGDKPAETDFYLWHAEAIVGAWCDAFAAWQRGFSTQLSYPMGAVCSATLPPSPNVPIPLAGGRSPGDAGMGARALASRMIANYGAHPKHPELTKAVFDSVAGALAQTFTAWKAGTMITQVVGVGGVAPSPPLPPGPVAGAIGNGGTLV